MALEDWPGHGRRQPARGRETPVVEQLGTAFGQGLDFLGTQQLSQPPPQLTAEPLENPADAVALLSTQRVAQPSPQHGALLVVHMERESEVHAVVLTARHGEDVGALVVGVVHDHVEHRHAAQRRRVLVGQDQPIPVLAFLTV